MARTTWSRPSSSVSVYVYTRSSSAPTHPPAYIWDAGPDVHTSRVRLRPQEVGAPIWAASMHIYGQAPCHVGRDRCVLDARAPYVFAVLALRFDAIVDVVVSRTNACSSPCTSSRLQHTCYAMHCTGAGGGVRRSRSRPLSTIRTASRR